MDDFAARFPRLLPVVDVAADAVGVLLGRRDVFDGCVDPDVENEVGCAALGVGLGRVVDAPLHIAGDTPVFQPGFEPLAGLILRVRRAFESVEKVREILLERRNLEELVGARAVLGGVAGDR